MQVLLAQDGDIIQFDQAGRAHRRQGADRPRAHRRDARRRGRRRGAARPPPSRRRRRRRRRRRDQPRTPARSSANRSSSRAASSSGDDHDTLFNDAAGAIAECIEASSVDERTDQGLMTEKLRVRAAPVLQETIGPAAAGAAGPDGDLTVAASSISRRISEFLGVALFALALIWLIALVTYEPTDPVWFFTTDACRTRRRTSSAASARSSPSCRSSCSATRAYFLPARDRHRRLALLLVPDARRRLHEGLRRRAAARLRQRASSASSSAAPNWRPRRSTPAASVGAGLGLALAEYLNRTGSIIVLLTAMMLSVILSTQFSFGRMFATATVGSRDLSARGLGAAARLDRRAAARAGAPRGDRQAHQEDRRAAAGDQAGPAPEGAAQRAEARAAARRPRPAASARRAAGRRRQQPETPSLLPDPEPPKAPAQRKNGTFTLPPHVAARRARRPSARSTSAS